MDEGLVKALYSNSILLTFYGLFIVENTVFPKYWLRIGVKILSVSLFFAAIVSIIQIKDPLFFARNIYVKGLTFEQLVEYYNSHGYESTARIRRFLTGYRNSIFSYINLASVGIDGIAIFSLLIAIKTKSKLRILFFVIFAGLVSFLSSSRWIMLNFLIVASQSVWLSKNKVSGILQFVVYSLGILTLLFISLYAIGFDIESFIENRLMSKSADTRFLAFEVFDRVFPENPIFGTGGTDTELMVELLGGQSSQIHVGYLKLFYYYGLIGGVLYLGFLGTLLIRLWKMAKASNYWGGFFALFAFAMINLTLFELSLFYYGLMLAIIFANHFYREEKQNVNMVQANQASKKSLIAKI
ncbi:O-antigen ligase family protein [Zobellia nedashkovskayae]